MLGGSTGSPRRGERARVKSGSSDTTGRLLPGLEARQWRLLYLVHVVIGITGIALASFLPGAPGRRVALVIVVVAVYLPLGALVQLVLPGPPRPWTPAWWLVLVVNCGIIGLFQGSFPAVAVPALLAYVLAVVAAGHLFGLTPALVVAAGAETAAVTAHLLGQPGVTNPFILAMLGVMLAAAAWLVGGLAGERWRAYQRLEGARSDFMSMVSHELRTPIAGIQGFTSLLDVHWDRLSERERRELVGKVAANVRFLDDLVARLLDLSRLEEGRFMLWREPCELLSFTRSTVGRLEGLLGPRQVVVRGEPALAEVDRLALDRILENLLTNAAKFSPARRPVVLHVGHGPAGPRISVRDHGPGIPHDERGLIFESFYRSPDTMAPGTGLGLSVVRRLVELHEGTVRVEDAGPGARFVVTFPQPREGIVLPEGVGASGAPSRPEDIAPATIRIPDATGSEAP
jgi:signal transduction histidine kinase